MWIRYEEKALYHSTKVIYYMAKAAKTLALEKGFKKKSAELFSADLVADDESVVTFNEKGQIASLDLHNMAKMTKDEIIERLNQFDELDEDDINLLNS